MDLARSKWWWWCDDDCLPTVCKWCPDSLEVTSFGLLGATPIPNFCE